MAKHRVVFYTQRVEIVSSYNERRDCADQRIPMFIQTCGFVPIPLPNETGIVRSILEETKPAGIFLTGGNSLVKYGGDAPERDEMEHYLIETAIKEQIPVYGFCRGMQMVLDYFGCDLIDVNGHVAVRHHIQGEETETEVNSYHKQGCISLTGDELEVIMRSDDGVIEKIRHKSLPIIGTMWHPERENAFCEADVNMIKHIMGVI